MGGRVGGVDLVTGGVGWVVSWETRGEGADAGLWVER